MKKIYLKTGNEAALEIDLPFGTVDTQIEFGESQNGSTSLPRKNN